MKHHCLISAVMLGLSGLIAPQMAALEPSVAESEFASVAEARDVEAQLRAAADKVAPAVVKLFGGPGDDGIPQDKIYRGSGVVIDPTGLILTHGHHHLAKGTSLKAEFPDGQVVDVIIESVFTGSARDFSLLKIRKEGRYPAVILRRDTLPAVGDRCFHFGYPGALNEIMQLATPVLRLGRVAGIGDTRVYANCLISANDSGGPLFDLEGRLIGVLDLSIGPFLWHPGEWVDVMHILDGATFLTVNRREEEVVKMGFLDGKRDTADTRRHFVNSLCADLLAPARRATVEVLIDGQPAILGTIVDAGGLVITKRSEIMTDGGLPLGSLSCRMFDGEELPVKTIADSREEDVALLQLPRSGCTAAPFSFQPEPRRGVITVVPVPGKAISETGVVGSVDQPARIAPWQGSVPLKVEEGKAGVTVSTSAQELKENHLAGLIRGTVQEGDVITEVDGQPAPDLAAYEKLANRETLVSGDLVQLTMLRDGATICAVVPLDSYHQITSNSYADPSLRLTGFSAVFTHDTIVGRRQCGGPIVDLEGRVIGVNIARFHRYSTLAIPPQRILQLVKELSARATAGDGK